MLSTQHAHCQPVLDFAGHGGSFSYEGTGGPDETVAIQSKIRTSVCVAEWYPF